MTKEKFLTIIMVQLVCSIIIIMALTPTDNETPKTYNDNHIVSVPCVQTNEIDGQEICTVYILSDGNTYATDLAPIVRFDRGE